MNVAVGTSFMSDLIVNDSQDFWWELKAFSLYTQPCTFLRAVRWFSQHLGRDSVPTIYHDMHIFKSSRAYSSHPTKWSIYNHKQPKLMSDSDSPTSICYYSIIISIFIFASVIAPGDIVSLLYTTTCTFLRAVGHIHHTPQNEAFTITNNQN